jgi:putative transposase
MGGFGWSPRARQPSERLSPVKTDCSVLPRGGIRQRFEIPSRYRQLTEVHLRYARWDFSRVDLSDARTGTLPRPVHPLDKAANADALRRRLAPPPPPPSHIPVTGIAPLLKKMMADYAATGLPPAYLPTPDKEPT